MALSLTICKVAGIMAKQDPYGKRPWALWGAERRSDPIVCKRPPRPRIRQALFGSSP